MQPPSSCGFASPLAQTAFLGRSPPRTAACRVRAPPPTAPAPRHRGAGGVRMILGGGGFLGVGPSEVLVIMAVGWFVLGPKQLMVLSRDVGKLLGELRRATDDARSTFTDALESDMAALDARDKATPVEGPALADQPAPVLESEEELAARAAAAKADGSVLEPLRKAIEPLTDAAREVAPLAGAAAQPMAKFAEQLRRAADPNQSAAADDVPNIDMDEDEVVRLEMQLQDAKARLERKRQKEDAEGASKKEAVGDT